jgi:hypothetical protein
MVLPMLEPRTAIRTLAIALDAAVNGQGVAVLVT